MILAPPYIQSQYRYLLLSIIREFMSLSKNIKQVLALLNKAVGQTPRDKQTFLTQKVQRVVEKYNNLDPQINQPAYLRQLQFNLNFIRLSFPHLDYTPPVEQDENSAKIEEKVEEAQNQNGQYFELENKEQVQRFVEETAQAIKGVRQEVQFSNWGTDNLDPQDLKRHKQLLKRQHFAGQFWQGKEKPVSPTAAYLQHLMQNEPSKRHEKIQVEGKSQPDRSESEKSSNWEKVKR